MLRCLDDLKISFFHQRYLLKYINISEKPKRYLFYVQDILKLLEYSLLHCLVQDSSRPARPWPGCNPCLVRLSEFFFSLPLIRSYDRSGKLCFHFQATRGLVCASESTRHFLAPAIWMDIQTNIQTEYSSSDHLGSKWCSPLLSLRNQVAQVIRLHPSHRDGHARASRNLKLIRVSPFLLSEICGSCRCPACASYRVDGLTASFLASSLTFVSSES